MDKSIAKAMRNLESAVHALNWAIQSASQEQRRAFGHAMAVLTAAVEALGDAGFAVLHPKGAKPLTVNKPCLMGDHDMCKQHCNCTCHGTDLPSIVTPEELATKIAKIAKKGKQQK